MTTGLSANVSHTWTWQDVEWGAWDTVLQLTSACLGALGNLVVIMVLFHQRPVSRSTDTLIGSLAVADCLTSLFLLPFPRAITVPSNWLGHSYCWIVYTNGFQCTCITASMYILLLVCFDRYIAIVYPLKYRRYFSTGRVHCVVVVIWMGSLTSLFTGFCSRIEPVTHECMVLFPTELIRIFVGSLTFAFLYVIPVMTMFTTQILSARALLRQSRLFSSKSHPRPTYHLAARRKVLRMMTTVVAIFIVTLGPNQFAYFCYNLGVMPEWFYLGTLHRSTVVLASFNSFANPFIYAWQNKRFRQGFRDIFTVSNSDKTGMFGHI